MSFSPHLSRWYLSSFTLMTALYLSLGALTGCDSDEPPAAQERLDASPPAGGTLGGSNVQSPDLSQPDLNPDDMGDEDMGAEDVGVGYDLEVPPEHYAEVPEPSERLRAGYAERSLGFPLGAAVVGFGPRNGVVTPFAETYPGTAPSTPRSPRAP